MLEGTILLEQKVKEKSIRRCTEDMRSEDSDCAKKTAGIVLFGKEKWKKKYSNEKGKT